jgi:hypothetical protein
MNAHFSTLGIGNFVAQAWYFPVKAIEMVIGTTGFTPSMHMIFPFESDLVWPPGPFLKIDEIQKLAQTDLSVHPNEALPDSNQPWRPA